MARTGGTVSRRVKRQTGAWIAASPERAIGELSLLSEKDRHQLIVEWNRT